MDESNLHIAEVVEVPPIPDEVVNGNCSNVDITDSRTANPVVIDEATNDGTLFVLQKTQAEHEHYCSMPKIFLESRSKTSGRPI